MIHFNYHTKYPECPFIHNFKQPFKQLDFAYQELDKDDCYERIDILLDDHKLFEKDSIINFINDLDSNLNAKYFIIEQNLDTNTKDQFINFHTTIYNILFKSNIINQEFEQKIKYSFIPLFYDDYDSIMKIFQNELTYRDRKERTELSNKKNRIIKRNLQDKSNTDDVKHDKIEKFEKNTISQKVNRTNKIVIPEKYRGSRANLRSSLISESKQRRLRMNPHLLSLQKKANLSIQGVSDKINVKKNVKSNHKLFDQKTEELEIRNLNGKFNFYPPTSGRIYVENLTKELSFISIIKFDSNIIITLHKINYTK